MRITAPVDGLIFETVASRGMFNEWTCLTSLLVSQVRNFILPFAVDSSYHTRSAWIPQSFEFRPRTAECPPHVKEQKECSFINCIIRRHQMPNIQTSRTLRASRNSDRSFCSQQNEAATRHSWRIDSGLPRAQRNLEENSMLMINPTSTSAIFRL